MIKKVVLGLVFAGLIGILVFGAVNRTLARWSETGYGEGGQRHGQGGGYGQADAPSDYAPRDGQGGHRGGRGGGQGYGGGPSDNSQRLGQEVGTAESGRVGASRADRAVGWLTLTGTVASADDDGITVKMTDGTLIEIPNRAWWYAQSQGSAASAGDSISLVVSMTAIGSRRPASPTLPAERV